MADNVHKGHRQRVREKFLREGLDVFEPHEALELMLYYAVPYKDTNPMAHKLLEQFGSISSIFDAKPEYLRQLGYSDNVISLIKLIPQINRLYMTDKSLVKDKTVNFNELGEYFMPRFYGRSEETLYLLLTDFKDRELYSGVISKGSINSTDVPLRRILELSLSYNAKCAVLAHNHPRGSILPSSKDLDTTALICESLKNINVRLLDHIILNDNEYFSLANSRFAKRIFSR